MKKEMNNIRKCPYCVTEYQGHPAICSSDFCLTRVEGDELKTISYYDACKMWWDNMTDENKQIIQTIPNFNKGKFYEITGIKIQEG